jgi:hypothetical protein
VVTAVLAGGLVAAGPAARDSLSSAWHELAGGRRFPLVLAAACEPLVPGLTAAAWRSVLAAHGAPPDVRQAWWCYGAGSLANTLLPGRMGDALRIELFSRRLPHSRRPWLACGVATSIGLVRASSSASCSARRPRCLPCRRVAALARSVGRLFACISASATARLVVIASVLDALAVPHPLSAAVIASGGLALGNDIPLAPGGAGLAAATMAVALGQTGLHASTAVAAAVAFHAFERGGKPRIRCRRLAGAAVAAGPAPAASTP